MEIHMFRVDDALKYDVTTAAVLESIRTWLRYRHRDEIKVYGGRRWIKIPIKAFTAFVPYLSENQIRRRVKRLELDGRVLSKMFNIHNWDTSKWYTVDEEEFSSESSTDG